MPAMLPAAVGASAIGTAAIGGTALGAGLTAGAALAGGAALPGLLGGMGALGGAGTAGSVLGGAALTPAVASLAPAATAQAMGPTLLQASLPGIQGGAGALGGAGSTGLTSSALQSAGLNTLKSQALQGGLAQMPGAAGYNPAIAQNLAPQFLQNAPPIADPNNLNFLNSSVAGGNTMPLETLNSFPPVKQGLDPTRALQTPSLANPTAAQVNPADIVGRSIRPNQNFMQNLGNIGSFQDVKDYAVQHPYATSAAVGLGTMGLTKMMQGNKVQTPESNAMIRPYTYERTQRPEAYAVSPTMDSSEQRYFNDQYVAGEPSKAAEGGIAAAYAMGGSVENMSNMNAIGANTGYPMASLQTPMYSNPAMQIPEATNVIAPSADAGVGAYSGEQRFAEGGEAKTEGGYKYSYDPQTMQFTQLSVPTLVPSRGVIGGPMAGIGYAAPTPQPVKNPGTKVSGGIATPAMGPMQSQQATPINVPAYQSPEQQLGLEGFYDMMNQRLAGYGGYGGFAAGGGVGGEPNLGGYSDGGRLLKGPGDGVSDSIPASIGGRQPARLADGEFVVPARIVSELGNGSTEAGARKLYAMMDRIQKGRRKSVGKGKVAVDSKASKHLPA